MTGPDVARRDADGHLPEELLTLHALGESVPADAEAHLAGCAHCRAEAGHWRRVVEAGRSEDTVTPVAVPAGTWAAIARETGVSPGLVDESTTPAPQDLRTSRRARRSVPRWVPVAAALLVGLVGGFAGARAVDSPAAAPTPDVVASAALDPLDGDGSGAAEVTTTDGQRRLELRLAGVSAPTDGVLEVWLLDADGGLVSLGPVVGGTFDSPLPDDVDLTRFSTVDVSREPLDGNPAHSSDSALRGTLRTPA